MATLIIENTGLDHLYPDGIPIAEVSIDMPTIFHKVARLSSLAAHLEADYRNKTSDQKMFSELHGEGDRISTDFIEDAARDILPVFQPLQLLMGQDDTILPYEFDSVANPDKIIFRFQLMDTRLEDYKYNYTSLTNIDIKTDLNIVRNVLYYAERAIKDYILRELYDAADNDRKSAKYSRNYEQNRQYVAFWAKSDLSLLTQYHYAGI